MVMVLEEGRLWWGSFGGGGVDLRKWEAGQNKIDTKIVLEFDIGLFQLSVY